MVTAATVVAASATPGAWSDTATARGPERTTDLLVAGCATALALSLAWLWLLVTTTVVGLLRGRAPTRDGALRRLVLLACGAAVVAGATGPAYAAGGEGEGAGRLVGLPLPERAVAPSVVGRPAAHPPAVGDAYVVRPGDSLWSIARAHPAPGASVETRWRAIWGANRDVVGDDPDLIHPGQALRLPATHPDTDGERR